MRKIPSCMSQESHPALVFRAAFSIRDDNTERGHHWTPLGRDERLPGVDFTVLLLENYLGCIPT